MEAVRIRNGTNPYMRWISRIAAAVWRPGFNIIGRRVGSFPGSTGPITVVRRTGLLRNPIPGSIGRFSGRFSPNGISGNITAAPGSPSLLGSAGQTDGHGLKNWKGTQQSTAGAGSDQPAPFFLHADNGCSAG
jgi:hypothetical protein